MSNKIITLFLLICLISCLGTKQFEQRAYKVFLRPSYSDHYNMFIPGPLGGPREEPFDEEIINFLSDYNLVNVYSIPLQNLHKDSIDCIISFCTVRNSAGQEFIVVDQNNDEDFSNDSLLEYNSIEYYIEKADSTMEWSYVDSEVEYEYYHENRIVKDNFPLRLLKMQHFLELFSATSFMANIGLR